jgi:uncharacterized protein YecE (DUF72 family)
MALSEALDPDNFFFRGLHPDVCMGTASDRYAGWIGQIYTPELYKGGVTRRTKKVGGKSFREEVLPVESVAEYFLHFRTLEVDYTFYSPLINSSNEPTHTFHVLSSYGKHLSANDRIILKVPQTVFARKLRRGDAYGDNTDYLNPDFFVRSFYQPAVDLLGPNLAGLVFEQEYQRKEDRSTPRELADALNGFFSSVPPDHRYHIELRTESYLTGAVFEVLERFGIGQVLSHWTWLPPLAKQFAKAGRRFFNSGGQCIIRLMTPIGTRYEDAYAKAHPFAKLVQGMLQPSMIDDTVSLMLESISRQTQVNVIINNRSGGNAPLVARLIARKFMEMAKQEP